MPAVKPKSYGKSALSAASVATILVLVYALVGGVLVIVSAVAHVDPALALSFKSYLSQMVVASAGLAVGRGIATHTGT
jgi:hypothetical protein